MSHEISRRSLIGGLLAVPALGVSSALSSEVVPPIGYPYGTIVVSTSQRKLYFVQQDGTAIRYNVAVGKPGKQWFGERIVDAKYVRPAWSPPDDVKRDNPRLPDVIASGAPGNPMGERALTLAPGQYAIHGTNRPDSIGRYASYGCIRMHNADIIDMFDRVKVGTRVIVVK